MKSDLHDTETVVFKYNLRKVIIMLRINRIVIYNEAFVLTEIGDKTTILIPLFFIILALKRLNDLCVIIFTHVHQRDLKSIC